MVASRRNGDLHAGCGSFEEKDDIVVKAELPGMEKDNIEVNLSDNRLTRAKKSKNKKPRKKTTIDRTSFSTYILRISGP